MNELLNELERQYREAWKGYSPTRCRAFVESISNPEQARELLIRLLCVDLELSRTLAHLSADSQVDEDESRVDPCVELFKIQYPELEQDPLGLERLVVLDFALSIQHEEQTPNIESYLAICPSTRLLRNLEEAQARLQEIKYTSADEPTFGLAIDKSKSTVPQSSTLNSFVAPRVPFTLGRYLLIRYIGRGGMGFVYSAIDLSSTAKVAVKMMRRGDGWSVFRFIEEFRWLNQLNHPNLVRLYAAFAEGDARYFSMEYIEGKDIRRWYKAVNKDNSDYAAALKQSLGQLASAIHFLHTQGVIHRDIKSSNVMITPRGRTVLLDLGLAIRQADQNHDELPLAGEEMPGTLIYMSPEAYNNQPLTPASDWYSLGVTIYELLVGEIPHASVEQCNREGIDSRLFVHDPQQLARNLSAAPQELAELCLKLLQLEPNQRPSGIDVLEALGYEVPETADVGWICLGREHELAGLNEARDRRLSPKGSNQLIVVSGDAGMGKSMLLQAWLANCNRDEYFVLSVKNYRQDFTPNRLMNSIVQELVRLSGLSPQVTGELFEPHAMEIGLCFPQIAQISGTSGIPIPSTSITKDLVEQSIGQLLFAVGRLSQIKPLIIAIDDAQWADISGLSSLYGLLELKERFHGIVILASEISGLREINDALSNVTSVEHLRLEPLGREVCQLMLEDWSRQSNLVLSQAEAKRLIRLGKGSPFLLRELFRSLLDQQIANSDYQTTEVTLRQLVSRRFARMPKQAETVLQYLAIADQPLLFQQLLATCRLTPLELHACLNILGHQGWVRIRDDSIDTIAELASESFRDAIVDTMPEDRLQRRHFRLARTLSSEIDPPWSRIAMHYEKTTKYRLAAACHIQAARDAFQIGAYREALYFIEKGSHKDAQRSLIEQQQLQLMQAECHATLGDSDTASRLLLKFADEESDTGRAIELRCRAGDQLLRNGNMTDGIKLLRNGLSKCHVATGQPAYLRMRNGLSAWWIASRSIPTALVQESQIEKQLAAATPAQPSEASNTQTSLYVTLMRSVIPIWFFDPEQAAAVIVRLAPLAESSEYGLAFRNQALLTAGMLLSQYGQRYNENSVQRFRLGSRITRLLGTVDAGHCQLVLMIWCMNQGRFRIAHRYAQKAKSALGYTPSWERIFVSWYEMNILWLSGRLSDLVNAVGVVRNEGQPLRQPTFQFLSNVFPTIATELVQDRLDQARTMVASARSYVESEPKMQPRCYYWFSIIAVELYQNSWEAAIKALEDQWRWFAQSGLLNFGNLAFTAYSLRINATLLRLRDHAGSRKLIIEIQNWITELKQTSQKALGHLADAYQLIFDAQSHGCRDFSQWKQVQSSLQCSGLTLYAQALQWHESLYADPTYGRNLRDAAVEKFREQGCLAPGRLMNLILPLPTQDA